MYKSLPHVLLLFSTLFYPAYCGVLSPSNAGEVDSLKEIALKSIANEDYKMARDALRKIFSNADKHYLGDNDYFYLKIQLAIAEAKLGNVSESKHILKTAIQEHPQNNFLAMMKILQAKIFVDENKIEKGYDILCEAKGAESIDNWYAEDRSFLASVEDKLSKRYGDILLNASKFSESGDHEEAVKLYRTVWNAIQKNHYPPIFKETFGKKLKRRIVYTFSETLYFSNMLQEANHMLKENVLNEIDDYDKDEKARILFLSAVINRKMKNHKEAIKYLMHFLELQNCEILPQYFKVIWELGVNNFELQNNDEGFKYFEKLTKQQKDLHLRNMAYLYQAKYYIKSGDYKAASNLLSPLKDHMYADGNLRYEWSYLQGESAFQSHNYLSAVEFFEKSIPQQNKSRAQWFYAAMYNLGWSYMKLGEKDSTSVEDKEKYLTTAEKIFQEIINLKPDNERAYLAIARVFLLQRDVLNKKDAANKVDFILSTVEKFSSLRNEAEALFLRAEAVESFIEKRKLYELLTNDKYCDVKDFFGESWYYKGINELKILHDYDSKNKNQDFEEISNSIINEAEKSFVQAYEILQHFNTRLAVLSLFYRAQTCSERDDRNSQLLALKILDNIFEKYNDKLSTMEEQWKIFYLQGIVASNLSADDDNYYTQITESAFKKVLAYSSKDDFIQQSLFGLGRAYFQQKKFALAEKTFTSLASGAQTEKSKMEAWFWVAEAMKRQNKARKDIQEILKKIFESNANSPHAAEAYFSYYDFVDYLQGKEEAINHLYTMERKFPDSPFLIFAYYLIGLDYKRDRINMSGTLRNKNFELALDAFDRVGLFFEYNQRNNSISKEHEKEFVSIYYRSFLEAAKLKLEESENMDGARKQMYLDTACNILNKISADFADKSKDFVANILASDPYPKIYEEIEFLLGLTYLKINDEISAEKIFLAMIDKYAINDIKNGYFLSKALYSQGEIFMRRHEYLMALEYFLSSEKSAKVDNCNFLSTEENLDLWLQQSECFRILGRYDESMLTLSKIINEDGSSSSQLYTRAMFLRANIYEIQGRTDLARRQLEATQRQGGVWADKAQEKLIVEYNFHQEEIVG